MKGTERERHLFVVWWVLFEQNSFDCFPKVSSVNENERSSLSNE